MPDAQPFPDHAAADPFPGDSEAAALMRAIDWSKTPLGAPAAWPQSLRTIVPILLASRFGMRVLWGPEFLLLYNDAYRPVLGKTKHPGAMGSRTAESFREIWDIVGPLFRRVYAGEAVALEDTPLPLDRNGYLEECYFTLSYSPIQGDDGRIGGLLGVVNETTARVLSERRLQTLREVAASASSKSTPNAAFERASTAFARNPFDVPFALFYATEADGTRARLVSSAGLDGHPAARPSAIQTTPTEETETDWPLARAAAQKRKLTLRDVRERFGELRSGPYPESIREAIVVPMRRPGHDGAFGFFVAGVNPRRELDDAYLGFFDLAFEHVLSAVSEALDRQERERLIERQRASDDRIRRLFHDAPIAIAVLRGPALVFELANPHYYELVGRKELVGRPYREARPELIEQGIVALLEGVYASGQPYVGKEFPVKLARKSGGALELGYFNFTAQPMHDTDGTIDGIILFAVEITEQVVAIQAEAAARAAAERGRAERASLLETAQIAREQAERSSKAKDEFLAIVSHELRNPLSAMLGWTRLLRSGTLSNEQRERGLETIERNAVNQSQLIEDLLDVSRIVSGKLKLEVRVVNFGDVVHAALDSARPAMDAKQLRIKAVLGTEATSLMGDATRLQQIVWNLLTNATKFTPKGGSIQVVLTHVDSVLELTVTDTGRGIQAPFLPYIFEPFKQADSTTTRAHGGLGLGLSIAKNLVEMHGGTITAMSAGQDRGSTFVVRLPVAPLRETPSGERSPTPAQLAQLDCPPELAGLRVLVVDDETDGRELIATVLESCGALVESTGSAREALVKLDSWAPDVILSDIGMPDEDGFALIRQIRGRAPALGGTVPAASLTAYAGAEDRRRALLAGFNMHVPKPVEPAELVAVVANLGRIARALK